MAIASQYYICNKCRFRSTLLSRIDDHLLDHGGTNQPSSFPHFDCFERLKLLKCPSCDYSTESLVLLRYHLVRNHDQQQFALKAKLKTCRKCGFCTHSNYLWLRHRNFTTCKPKKRSKKKKRVSVLKKMDLKWHFCEKCDYRTLYTSNLKTHVIYKHTPLEEIVWQHCTQCPAKFKIFDHLKKHQTRAHGSAHLKKHSAKEKQYKCDQCPYKTNDKSNLKKHIICKHLREDIYKGKNQRKKDGKWYLCENCDFRTVHLSHLKTHIIYKHTPLKDIIWQHCTQCPAKFKVPHDLKRHRRWHAPAEDRLNCAACDFSTSTRNALRTHFNRKHAAPEEIKWVECYHCGAKFKGKDDLRLHLISHTTQKQRYKCDQCPFKTHYKHSFKRHVANVHTKPKRSKQTSSKDKVGDVKLFKCGDCDYSSKYETNLKNHVLLKHNKDGKDF